MNFEILENFDWYNEPDNVRFENNEMVIYAQKGTDFWQSIHRDFKKDNAHFFFCRQKSNFSLDLKWNFEQLSNFSQCGLMLRVDERNWFKLSIMNKNADENILASVLTLSGHSDWAGFDLKCNVNSIWFKIQRVDNDYIVYYSLNGENYIKFRTFYMKNYEDVKVGAYIASPNDLDFFACLSELNIFNS